MQYMIVYKGRLLKNLHWQIKNQRTLVSIDSESYQTLFPSFCSPPSEVAVISVLFYSKH